MDDTTETSPWKQKYLSAIERLESEEQRWSEIEQVLRQAVSRLSLAATGFDKRLDRVLKDFRVAARQETDCAQVRRLTEQVAELLPELDEGVSRPEPSQGGWRGLLSRWQRSGGKRAGEPRSSPSEETATRAAAQRELLLAMVDELDEVSYETRRALQERVEQADREEALGELASELMRLLRPVGDDDRLRDPDRPGPSEVLIILLERLHLPAEESDEVQRLRQRLEDNVSGEGWRECVSAVADLANRARRQVQQEKQDFERFLAQVTERLDDMDSFLKGQVSDQDEATRHGSELSHTVEQEVRSIEDSVHRAEDLTQLQTAVQTRLQTIESAMHEFTQKETERIRQADERAAQMRERMHELETETEQLRSTIRERYEQALKDPLTGIGNRLAYEEQVPQELARSRRFGIPLSMLMWDVDHFKRINDRFGHSAGDKALSMVANMLVERVRETDFVARYGGEEFVMLLPGTGKDSAAQVADEVREAIAATPFHYSREPVKITVSCGVVEAGTNETAEALFERADRALYTAKEQGRNQCVPG